MFLEEELFELQLLFVRSGIFEADGFFDIEAPWTMSELSCDFFSDFNKASPVTLQTFSCRKIDLDSFYRKIGWKSD